MTDIEALEILTRSRDTHEASGYETITEALGAAVKHLKKAQPKKVMTKKFGSYICPSCANPCGHPGGMIDNYCSVCGQRLEK